MQVDVKGARNNNTFFPFEQCAYIYSMEKIKGKGDVGNLLGYLYVFEVSSQIFKVM